jgi:hypothetical protein
VRFFYFESTVFAPGLLAYRASKDRRVGRFPEIWLHSHVNGQLIKLYKKRKKNMHYVLVVIITCIIWGYLGGLAAAVATGLYLFYVLLQYAIARLFTTTAKYYESLAASNMTIIAFLSSSFFWDYLLELACRGITFHKG